MNIMKKPFFVVLACVFSINGILAQIDSTKVESKPKNITYAAGPALKSEKQLKLEEKEAKKVAKALKRANQLEKIILDLENGLATDKIALQRLQDRHLNTKIRLDEVKREKLELKIAKLEMRMAKNRAKLSKYRKKVI